MGLNWAMGWYWALCRFPCRCYVGKVGMGLSWAFSMGLMLIICGRSGHGLELGNHAWVPYGLKRGNMGMGWNWAPMAGPQMCYKWAKWGWATTGHICMGPVWIVWGPCGHGLELGKYVWAQCGLSGHGLELGTYDWVPYGFCKGHVTTSDPCPFNPYTRAIQLNCPGGHIVGTPRAGGQTVCDARTKCVQFLSCFSLFSEGFSYLGLFLFENEWARLRASQNPIIPTINTICTFFFFIQTLSQLSLNQVHWVWINRFYFNRVTGSASNSHFLVCFRQFPEVTL